MDSTLTLLDSFCISDITFRRRQHRTLHRLWQCQGEGASARAQPARKWASEMQSQRDKIRTQQAQQAQQDADRSRSRQQDDNQGGRGRRGYYQGAASKSKGKGNNQRR